MIAKDRITSLIQNSNFVSRDLSWLQFNYRVLDQAKKKSRTVFEKLKFLAITSSNLDEFFMIRVGSLYNYLDYGKSRLDYSGLREDEFQEKLYKDIHKFCDDQNEVMKNELIPSFKQNGMEIVKDLKDLSEEEKKMVKEYFKLTVFPMLTPMVYDAYHTFPILQNLLLIFAVVTTDLQDASSNRQRLSFVQIPKNLPRFYEIEREDSRLFIPIEVIIRSFIGRLFRNVDIESISLFRITRNGDFTLEESEDLETDFINELKIKLKTRKTGRVVRVEIEEGFHPLVKDTLTDKWNLDKSNFFLSSSLIDFTGLWQIVGHRAFRHLQPASKTPVRPLSSTESDQGIDIFSRLQKSDILLHHPYHSADHMLELVESASKDPNVLAIKMTIYRLAKDSRVTKALLRAVESGKHVSALFEVKARFDEENNIEEARKLQQAGCFVIYGVSSLKTHTKLMLVVRKEGKKVRRYVHLGSGNYNESTSKLYTDIGLMSSNPIYGEDVSEFFNAITGHSVPSRYEKLVTAPREMRKSLINLIEREAANARDGKKSGIVVKVNSLQDDKFINALYKASQVGVPIKLIVRGICCLRPERKGLSENISVKSIVGDYLEHTRLFYFHNEGDPIVLGGSADAMVRSFDRRIESLFEIVDTNAKKEAVNILDYNLKDNVNSYKMNEDGSYTEVQTPKGQKPFNAQIEFFKVSKRMIDRVKLF